jgi:hypothetical protein
MTEIGHSLGRMNEEQIGILLRAPGTVDKRCERKRDIASDVFSADEYDAPEKYPLSPGGL